jgi:hypothetical protein
MDHTQMEPDTSAAASQTAGMGSRFTRIFNRIFTRHLMNMAILMVVPMLLAPTLNIARTLLVDPDIWWHLANARILCTAHHFIHVDPYSFTVIGQPWINWEWLSELPYWFSYQAFGLRGIYLITWLVLCANILFVYWRGYWKAGHAGAAFWAAGIGFVLMTVNSGPRTIAIAYLAMSAELAILEAAERGKTKLLWLLPPLFCVWINLHGIWFIGICLLVLYIVCGLFRVKVGAFEQEAFTREERNRLLAVLGSSVVLLLVNPYGWHLLWNPVDMILNQTVSVATIAEWKPLDLSTLEGKGVIVAIGLMVLANLIRGRKWKVFELGIVFLAWYAAVAHVRFSFLAAVLTTPLLAVDMKRSFCTESDEKTIPAMNALMVAGAVGLMVFMFPTQSSLKDMLAKMFPLQTIASIQPSWRTLDWDYVGGMMAFQSKPSFIDSRFDSFEHVGVMQDSQSIMYGQNALELMAKYRVDHVLLLEGMPLSYLLQHTPGWQVEAREKAWEGNYVLYAKTPGAAAPSASCAPSPSGAQVGGGAGAIPFLN